MRNCYKFIMITAALLAFCFLFAGCAQQKVTRHGSVIGLRPEKLEEYKQLHANVWPGVLKKIMEYNILNYSVYLTQFPDGKLQYEFTRKSFDCI